MSYQKRQLEDMKKYFLEIRQVYMDELKELPKGKLWSNINGKRQQYYIIEIRNGAQTRRGINRDKETINKLARKKFIEKIINEIDSNIALLDRTITEFRDIDPNVIIDSMTKAYKTLSRDCFFTKTARRIPGKSPILPRDPDEIFYTDEELAKARYDRHIDWANASYIRSSYRPEELIETTSRGERMRSKSEVLLAEAFYKYKIPFRYEDTTETPWLGTVPDFTFQDYYNELFYLEYCGMMDNEKYVNNLLRKRDKYEDNGIYEWNNIIYIYEKGNRINMEMVESIIKNQILPRL